MIVNRATNTSRGLSATLLAHQIRDEGGDDRADESAAAQQVDQRVAKRCQGATELCKHFQRCPSKANAQQRLPAADFQLIIDIAFTSDGKSDGFNLLFLLHRPHRPA